MGQGWLIYGAPAIQKTFGKNSKKKKRMLRTVEEVHPFFFGGDSLIQERTRCPVLKTLKTFFFEENETVFG